MKLVRTLLPLLLVVAMVLPLASCGAPENKYTDLRAHVRETVGVGKGLRLTDDSSKVQVFIYLQAPKTEEDKAKVDMEPLYLSCIAYATSDNRYTHRVNLILDGDDSVRWEWWYNDTQEGRAIMTTSTNLSAKSYTGLSLIDVGDFEYLTTADTETETEPETGADTAPIVSTEDNEENARKYASELTALTLQAFDAYLQTTLGYSVDNLGFTSLDEKYRYTPSATAALPGMSTLSADFMTLSTDTGVAVPEESETAEDLGGAFSADRISYSIRMTLMGMGMVFAVLILLWLILLIFKNVLGEKNPRGPKTPVEEAPAPAAPAPVAPVGEDPALVAAITAAIAAAIEADDELSAQFIGGFRVVSFQRRSGKTSWNH